MLLQISIPSVAPRGMLQISDTSRRLAIVIVTYREPATYARQLKLSITLYPTLLSQGLSPHGEFSLCFHKRYGK